MAEHRLVSSIAWNYAKFLTLSVVSFFLSPFLVHRWGAADYGLWSVTLGTVSFLKLLDLGVNPAIVRFVARDAAVNDRAALARTISTGRAFFWVAASLVVAMTALGTALVPHLMRLPSDQVEKARAVFLLVGLDLAMNFLFNVWNASLVGLQRFAAVSAWTLATLLVKTLFIVLLVRAGFGVRTLAVLAIVETVVRGMGLRLLADRFLPGLRVSFADAEKRALREIASYSFYAFLIAAAIQVIGPTDLIVVGKFISVEAVTPYELGSKFVTPFYDLLWVGVFVLTPLSADLEARGELGSLRRLHVVATKGAVTLALPLLFFFVAAGRDFLHRWVGDPYADSAYPILAILSTAQFFAIAQQPGVALLKGTGRVRGLAFLYVGEAAANLVISILLVRRFGLVGVAVGTLIPLAISNLIFLPLLACRVIGMPLGSYLREAIGPALLPAVPAFVVGVVVLRAIGPLGGYPALFAVFAGAVLLFWVPAAFLTVTSSERRALLARLRDALRARPSREPER